VDAKVRHLDTLCGGAFPSLVAKNGCIGTVAVSGLHQGDDHQIVVERLTIILKGLAER